MEVPPNHQFDHLYMGLSWIFNEVHQPAGHLPISLSLVHTRLPMARHFGSRQKPGPRTLAGEPRGQARRTEGVVSQ